LGDEEGIGEGEGRREEGGGRRKGEEEGGTREGGKRETHHRYGCTYTTATARQP
jgi:hypothetical protein